MLPDREQFSAQLQAFIIEQKNAGFLLRLISGERGSEYFSIWKRELQPGEQITLIIRDNETGELDTKKIFSSEDYDKVAKRLGQHPEGNERIFAGSIIGIYAVKRSSQ